MSKVGLPVSEQLRNRPGFSIRLGRRSEQQFKRPLEAFGDFRRVSTEKVLFRYCKKPL